MEFDLGQTHHWIVAELVRRRPVAESMAHLIDLCEAARPHADWTRLRALPYADLSALLEWIQRLFREEPHGRPLRGLWFGLFNPCLDDGSPIADLYVNGSERFVIDPNDNSWAVDAEWQPESRCARSAVLADIYRIAYRHEGANASAEEEDGLQNDCEYPLCLGYGAFALREVLGKADPSLLLSRSRSLGVAVGFDSGDFLLLGEFGASGLKRISRTRLRLKGWRDGIKHALGGLKRANQHAVSDHIAGLKSDDSKTRFWAAVALSSMGPRAKDAVPALIDRLQDQDFGNRQAVAHALGSIGPSADAAVPPLLRTLKDDQSEFVSQSIAQALGGIGTPAAVAALVEALDHQDSHVRCMAAISLKVLGLHFPGSPGLTQRPA